MRQVAHQPQRTLHREGRHYGLLHRRPPCVPRRPEQGKSSCSSWGNDGLHVHKGYGTAAPALPPTLLIVAQSTWHMQHESGMPCYQGVPYPLNSNLGMGIHTAHTHTALLCSLPPGLRVCKRALACIPPTFTRPAWARAWQTTPCSVSRSLLTTARSCFLFGGGR